MASEDKGRRSAPFVISYDAPVTLTFTILALIVVLIGMATKQTFVTKYFCSYFTKWSDPLMYVRMFTHVLGHSGWAHYIGNILLLLILGPILENKYGSKNLLEMIAITAFVTSLVYMIFFRGSGLCGASGIVFMFIILASTVNFKKQVIPLSFILVFLLYIGGEVVDAVTINDNVAQLAHVIGGVCGAAFGAFYAKNK